MLNIGAIIKSCATTNGGLDQVFIIIPNEGFVIDRNLNAPVAIVTLYGQNAHLIEFDKNSAEWSEEQQDGPGGAYYNELLSGTIKNLRLEVNYLRQLLQNRRVHILFTTRRGDMYIMPFAKIATKATSGKKMSEKDFYSFTFSTQSQFPLSITNKNILPNSVAINISDFVFNTTDGLRYRLYVTSVGGLMTVETTDAATVNNVLIEQQDDFGI